MSSNLKKQNHNKKLLNDLLCNFGCSWHKKMLVFSKLLQVIKCFLYLSATICLIAHNDQCLTEFVIKLTNFF